MKIKPLKVFIYLSVIAAVFAASLLVGIFVPVGAGGGEPHIIYVEYGSGFKQISSGLEKFGLIRNKKLFEAYMVLSGNYKKLKAGEYEFPSDSSIYSISEKMALGQVLKHKIVVPEGSDLHDIAAVLSDSELVDREKFLLLAKDKVFLRSIGIDYDSAEGFLFPDTYNFIKGEGEERIIKAMYKRFLDKVPLKMSSTYSPGGKKLSGYSVLKMASIIEKESKLDVERPLVASVFYNRLRSKEAYQKKLESCATVRYGISKKTGPLTYRDLKKDTPYNSYIYIGLPPTPICNPGLKSIEAAMNPAVTNYKYFVVETEGAHTFSETLEQHNAAKRKNKRLNR